MQILTQVSLSGLNGRTSVRRWQIILFGDMLSSFMALLLSSTPWVCFWQVGISLLDIWSWTQFLAYHHCRAGFHKLASAVVGHELQSKKWFISHSISFPRLTIPPNVLAAISIWTTIWLSSKVNRRAPFIIGAAGIAIIGKLLHTGTFIDFLFDYLPRIYRPFDDENWLVQNLDVYRTNLLFLSFK